MVSILPNEKQISKFLSLVLRHQPEKIKLTLDAQGWTPVDHLLQQMALYGHEINFAILQQVVSNSDKQRFAFNSDQTQIRANQGHSIDVELGYAARVPPDYFYHGSAIQHQQSILSHGLIKGQRHHVHLSSDTETATKVGQRHGKVSLFKVHASLMHREGHLFYCSANGVWLVDSEPVNYLELI